jgi:hypothetical protein
MGEHMRRAEIDFLKFFVCFLSHTLSLVIVVNVFVIVIVIAIVVIVVIIVINEPMS